MNLKDISIHAPARGATATNIENGKYSGDFNPRSREGSDDITTPKCGYCDRFQSTLPRGERLRSGGSSGWLCIDFNPRSREGSDSSG